MREDGYAGITNRLRKRLIGFVALARLARIRVSCSCSWSFRNSRSRFHGHDHEDSASPLSSFDQPVKQNFQRTLDRMTSKLERRGKRPAAADGFLALRLPSPAPTVLISISSAWQQSARFYVCGLQTCLLRSSSRARVKQTFMNISHVVVSPSAVGGVRLPSRRQWVCALRQAATCG